MFCTNCNTPINKSNEFCYACGAQLFFQNSGTLISVPIISELNFEKIIKKIKKSIPNSYENEFKSMVQQYKIARKNYKVTQRNHTKQIALAERNLQQAEKLLSSEAIAKCSSGILSPNILYRDRVVLCGETLYLDHTIDAYIEIIGDVYSTTNINHSARPTATRVVAGGLIAGPVGAVIGGAARKHKLTSTSEVVDDRKVILTVCSALDRKSVYLNYSDEMIARDFANQVKNAARSYEVNKNISKKEIQHAKLILDETKAGNSSGAIQAAGHLANVQSAIIEYAHRNNIII